MARDTLERALETWSFSEIPDSQRLGQTLFRLAKFAFELEEKERAIAFSSMALDSFHSLLEPLDPLFVELYKEAAALDSDKARPYLKAAALIGTLSFRKDLLPADSKESIAPQEIMGCYIVLADQLEELQFFSQAYKVLKIAQAFAEKEPETGVVIECNILHRLSRLCGVSEEAKNLLASAWNIANREFKPAEPCRLTIGASYGIALCNAGSFQAGLNQILTTARQWPADYKPRELARLKHTYALMAYDELGPTKEVVGFLKEAIPHLDPNPQLASCHSRLGAKLTLLEVTLENEQMPAAKKLLLELEEDISESEIHPVHRAEFDLLHGKALVKEGSDEGIGKVSSAYHYLLAQSSKDVGKIVEVASLLSRVHTEEGNHNQAFEVLNTLMSLPATELRPAALLLDGFCKCAIEAAALSDRREELLGIYRKAYQVYQLSPHVGVHERAEVLGVLSILHLREGDYLSAQENQEELFALYSEQGCTYSVFHELWEDIGRLHLLSRKHLAPTQSFLVTVEEWINQYQQGRPTLQAASLVDLCSLHALDDDKEQTLERLNSRISALLESAPDDNFKSEVLFSYGKVLRESGNLRNLLKANQVLDHACALVKRYSTDRTDLPVTRLSRALCLIELGESFEAEKISRKAYYELKQIQDDPNAISPLLTSVSILTTLNNDFGCVSQVKQYAGELIALVEASPHLAVEHRVDHLLSAASAYTSVGEPEWASRALARLRLIAEQDQLSFHDRFRYLNARVCIELCSIDEDSGGMLDLDQIRGFTSEMDDLVEDMEREHSETQKLSLRAVHNSRSMLADIYLRLYRLGLDLTGDLQAKLSQQIINLEKSIKRFGVSDYQRYNYVDLLILKGAFATGGADCDTAKKCFDRAISLAEPYISNSLPIVASLYGEYSLYLDLIDQPEQARLYMQKAEMVSEANNLM